MAIALPRGTHKLLTVQDFLFNAEICGIKHKLLFCVKLCERHSLPEDIQLDDIFVFINRYCYILYFLFGTVSATERAIYQRKFTIVIFGYVISESDVIRVRMPRSLMRNSIKIEMKRRI